MAETILILFLHNFTHICHVVTKSVIFFCFVFHL